MDIWEYAMLGWYTDPRTRREVWYWREGENDLEPIAPAAFMQALADAGRTGWELVTSTAMPKAAETLYFKRRRAEPDRG